MARWLAGGREAEVDAARRAWGSLERTSEDLVRCLAGDEGVGPAVRARVLEALAAAGTSDPALLAHALLRTLRPVLAALGEDLKAELRRVSAGAPDPGPSSPQRVRHPNLPIDLDVRGEIDASLGVRNTRFVLDWIRTRLEVLASGRGRTLCLCALELALAEDGAAHRPIVDPGLTIEVDGVLRQGVRSGDRVSFLGGGSFALLLHGTRTSGARHLFGRLCEGLVDLAGRSRRVSGGTGFTHRFSVVEVHPGTTESASALWRRCIDGVGPAPWSPSRPGDPLRFEAGADTRPTEILIERINESARVLRRLLRDEHGRVERLPVRELLALVHEPLAFLEDACNRDEPGGAGELEVRLGQLVTRLRARLDRMVEPD